MINKILILLLLLLESMNLENIENIENNELDIKNETIIEIQEQPAPTCTDLELETFNLINNIRIQNDLLPLEWDNELYETAKIRAAEASVSWSHTRPDGSHWSVMSEGLHGENLAKGYNSSDAVVAAWMTSEGHKENILRENFSRGAVFFYEGENGWFWCFHFGY